MIFGAFYERKSLDPLPPTISEVSVLNSESGGYFCRISIHFSFSAFPQLVYIPCCFNCICISCIYCIAHLCKIILPLLHFQREHKKWVSAGNHLPYYYYNRIKSPKNFQEPSVYIITNTWLELCIQQMQIIYIDSILHRGFTAMTLPRYRQQQKCPTAGS